MSLLALTLACGDYDRTRPLLDGRVMAEGIDFTPIVLPPPELFRRQARHAEFEVAEFSLATHAVLLSRGDTRFVGVPVFPSRSFRHGHILIHAASGIERPADLVGRRVGCPEYIQTAAVWVRDFLARDHGVRPGDMQWYLGGLDVPAEEERVEASVPEGLPAVRIGATETLSGLLERGTIDALISADLPGCFLTGSPNVRRLFPDYHQREIDYYRRTGHFPIMHLVVVRRDVYERQPWVARSVYKAFAAAKTVGFRQLSYSGALAAGVPFLMHALEEARTLMGHDYWPYGLAANRATLEALLAALHEQALTARPVTLEELFAPETWAGLDPEPEASRPS